MSANAKELFGRVRMGHVHIETQAFDAWTSLLVEGLGMHLASRTDDALVVRLDTYAGRFFLERGDAEDVVAIGYELDDDDALSEVLRRLAARGIAYTEADAERARARGVGRLVCFRGPKDLEIELFVSPVRGARPEGMKTRGFVTGENGLGHFAWTSKNPEAMRRFWVEIFDARHSDTVRQRISGIPVDIEFLRLNPRHHSIAIAATRAPRLDPLRTRVQHVNIEVETLDDLLGAFKRCRALGFEMAHEIGQHPNDDELSFYVIGPSGFELECGFRARSVDEATWQTTEYDAISAWGHEPERISRARAFVREIRQFMTGFRSVFRTEHDPLSGGHA